MESRVQHLLAGRPADSQAVKFDYSSRSLTNETEAKAKCLSDRLSDIVRVLANEPSLALFRIEEHVRKSVPKVVERRREVTRMTRDVQGHASDLENAVATLDSIGRSRASFESIHELAKNALFLKQQLDYDRRRRTMASSVTDAIKRSSADVVNLLSGPARSVDSSEAAAAPSGGGGGGGGGGSGGSVLESAKTFLRSKTLDYSQNLMRRSQATKSVEIPAGVDFRDAARQSETSAAATTTTAKRSNSADLLKPVSEEAQQDQESDA